MKIPPLVRTSLLISILLLGAGGAGAWYWWKSQQNKLPDGLVSGNGRIESNQIDIASKSAGRVQKVLVQEGDLVSPGQVLAYIDTTELQATRAKYVADLAAQEASRLEAKATVVQRQAELVLKEANLRRALNVVQSGAISQKEHDEAQSERDSARAILDAAQTSVTASERSIDAAQALINQTDAQIADAVCDQARNTDPVENPDNHLKLIAKAGHLRGHDRSRSQPPLLRKIRAISTA
jgi:HlyD family secretion protein